MPDQKRYQGHRARRGPPDAARPVVGDCLLPQERHMQHVAMPSRTPRLNAPMAVHPGTGGTGRGIEGRRFPETSASSALGVIRERGAVVALLLVQPTVCTASVVLMAAIVIAAG